MGREKEKSDSRRTLFWLIMGVISFSLFLYFAFIFFDVIREVGSSNNSKAISQVGRVLCIDMSSLNETLNLIDKNCGGTFILKRFGSNDWEVFQANVCDGQKCESKYIKLEDCLK